MGLACLRWTRGQQAGEARERLESRRLGCLGGGGLGCGLGGRLGGAGRLRSTGDLGSAGGLGSGLGGGLGSGGLAGASDGRSASAKGTL